MAEIATTTDRAADLTVQTVSGEVTARELLDELARFYAGEPTRNILWDFRAAALDLLTSTDLKIMALITRQNAGRRIGGRTALLFSSTFAYGLGRMYEQSQNASDLPVDHMSFLDPDAAMKWLRGEA